MLVTVLVTEMVKQFNDLKQKNSLNLILNWFNYKEFINLEENYDPSYISFLQRFTKDLPKKYTYNRYLQIKNESSTKSLRSLAKTTMFPASSNLQKFKTTINRFLLWTTMSGTGFHGSVSQGAALSNGFNEKKNDNLKF